MKAVATVRDRAAWLAAALAVCQLAVASTRAEQRPGAVARLVDQVGIDQHLDAELPLDLPLIDESGRPVKLGQYFGRTPVVLVLAYYRCPMLCTEVLNGLLKSSQAIPLVLSDDYQIVTVSIDPHETPELAAEKKRRYVGMYRRTGAAAGWHFLSGSAESVSKLADTVGFRYVYDPRSDQFAHASGIMVATSGGRLSRYFYGIDYPPNDLRLALVESNQGRIGTLADRVLLLCFHYDPQTGRYGLAIDRVLRTLGVVTVLALGSFLYVMVRKERARSRAWRINNASRGQPLETIHT